MKTRKHLSIKGVGDRGILSILLGLSGQNLQVNKTVTSSGAELTQPHSQIQSERRPHMQTINRSFAIMTAILAVFVLFSSVWAAEPQQVNINTATVEELSQLKGVGPAYAAKIVAYREANGPFTKSEDIMQVPGIGTKTFDVNKDRIIVGKKTAKQ
jgi:competence protein ComEA